MQVRTDFDQNSTLTLDSHHEGARRAEGCSGSSVMVLTARNRNQQASKEPSSHENVTNSPLPFSSVSRRLPPSVTVQGAAGGPSEAQKVSSVLYGEQGRCMPLPAGALDAELGTLSAASSCKKADEDHRVRCVLPDSPFR